MPEWITVQVSARILDWPRQCACCTGPADTYIAASHTRISGIKVVHSETKDWKVPYCQRCLEHIAAMNAARQIVRSAEENVKNLLAQGERDAESLRAQANHEAGRILAGPNHAMQLATDELNAAARPDRTVTTTVLTLGPVLSVISGVFGFCCLMPLLTRVLGAILSIPEQSQGGIPHEKWTLG